MGETINLRQARKARARDDKRKAGDENAARHGASKIEKALTKARTQKARAELDAHRRERDGE